MRSGQHFSEISELERARRNVFNYAVETLNETNVNGNFDDFLINSKCAGKLNLAFQFNSKSIDDGGSRYFNALKNNTLLDPSELVCTQDDLSKLKDILSTTDVIEICSRERMNTMWKSYKLTNLTVFGALLKALPMVCKDAVLPKALLKDCIVNCLTYEENTRQPYNDNLSVFRGLALHLHGSQRLKGKIPKTFLPLINRMDENENFLFHS